MWKRATVGLSAVSLLKAALLLSSPEASVAYNLFTEGFDTADLKAAKALLEELSNSP